ncbi:hypothetical protein JXA63_00015 [Candidatus Woesebacteria bacterium]|nr:hypothetical protein [Candidatus Woesebacteria bacterium]
MKKTLTYTSFFITSLLVILAFITATTYVQLGVAVILYPLAAFFAYKLFMVKNCPKEAEKVFEEKHTDIVKAKEKIKTLSNDKEEVKVVADIDKRAFLKIIGATGISFFLFSLLNRKSQGLLFGNSNQPGIASLTDGDGNKINPAERQPTDNYQIAQIDEGYIAYYGFTNVSGGWFIMKEDPDEGSFRYIKGGSDFSGSWEKRESLNYDYFDRVF